MGDGALFRVLRALISAGRRTIRDITRICIGYSQQQGEWRWHNGSVHNKRGDRIRFGVSRIDACLRSWVRRDHNSMLQKLRSGETTSILEQITAYSTRSMTCRAVYAECKGMSQPVLFRPFVRWSPCTLLVLLFSWTEGVCCCCYAVGVGVCVDNLCGFGRTQRGVTSKPAL